MNQILRSFAALSDKPCWGVTKGQGSFLTLEFGAPRLIVREPMVSPGARSARVRRMLARRHVCVAGEWHLWLYSCEWKAWSGDRIVGDSSSTRRINRAARSLAGQKLVAVSLSSRGARTRFEFDLGGVLETRPYDRAGEQWLLYEPNGNVLVLRADRRYCYGPSSQSKGKWRAA